MKSLILQTTALYMMALLLTLSVFLLWRGHNEPGGGFVGGLVAAAAFVLYALAFDPATTRASLRVDPVVFVGLGLLCAALSGVAALVAGRPFLTGLWWEWGGVDVGTPLIFDAGVYLTVLGVVLTVVLSLAEE